MYVCVCVCVYVCICVYVCVLVGFYVGEMGMRVERGTPGPDFMNGCIVLENFHKL